jgi:small subunit ribosomal protein S16
MLMMRLQRVGRKNDPSYRIVVTDKRTGPKSNKNVDLLGSYNPKLGHVQIDGEKAKHWLSMGVQPSVTLHNILVSQKIVEGKKINALSKKSPIVDEAAIKKAADEEAAKVKKAQDEADAKKAEEEAAELAKATPEVEETVAEVAPATEEKKEEEVVAV